MERYLGCDIQRVTLSHPLNINDNNLNMSFTKFDYKAFTLMGDGELDEGSNREAQMLAAHYQLDNLVAT